DEATRKDLFTDTFCKVCRAVLQFKSQRMSHYKGKKHAQRDCLYVQRHGKKYKRQGWDTQEEMDFTDFQMDETGIMEQNYCNLCNMILMSPDVALSHLWGKIHAKKVKQLSRNKALMPAQSMQPISAEELPSSSSNTSLELNNPNYCRLCCAPFNNPLSAQQHYGGKKHRRNIARKKIVEELGLKPVPLESGADGSVVSVIGFNHYTCPACNVLLSSIEEYQSHMQGKKHKIRAAKVDNLMKNSKKTYNIFQGQLTDCIQVQKATVLEQRTYLRITEKFQGESAEGRSDHGEVIPSAFKCEQRQHSNLFSETQSPANAREKRSPSCSSACEHALEKPQNCQSSTGYCVEGQTSEVAPSRGESFGPSVVESKDYCKLVLAETFSLSYTEEQKPQLKSTKEEKCVSEELKCKEEDTKLKRKENSEGADLRKESRRQKRMKFD
ncbi:ZMAT1 protein, partial [Penelope pileata]|nr:ZMAT1 protein [Penelope pileata]